MAESRTGIAGEHRVIALAYRIGGNLQMRRRLVRHVVLGIGGGLAVLADVSAQYREVAAVARPDEIVDLVAVIADRFRRRIHQADVLQLELADQIEIGAVIHVGDAATVTGLAFAFGHRRFARGIDRVVIAAPGLAARAGEDAVGDAVETGRHQHPVIRIGRQFRIAIGGDEALADQVAVPAVGRFATVVLDHAERDVVIGQHQAVARHEGAGRAADLHHGVHRRLGQLGQAGRIALETGGLELRGDIGQLRRHPHAFIGLRGRGQQRGGDRHGQHT